MYGGREAGSQLGLTHGRSEVNGFTAESGDSVITFTIRTLVGPDELRESQRLRAEIYCKEKHWIDRHHLTEDGREEDPFDSIAVHGGVFVDDQLEGTFRLIPTGRLSLPVQKYRNFPPVQSAVELSRLAVRERHRASVAMIGLCRWIYGQSVEMGATHMYALMEFELISTLLHIGFPFRILHGPIQAYKYSQDFVTVCPVADVVPGLVEADAGRKRKYAPLFANEFDGELSLSMLYPDTEMEVA
jgi:N-acyl-L-homoserine lactone synthetase